MHSTTLHSINYNYNYHFATLRYIHYRPHYIRMRYITVLTTSLKMQLQLQYTNYTAPQLQFHYTIATTTAALHHTTSSSCRWGDHCNHCSLSTKHSSNHLSVHQWICSAIRYSQQPASPLGFLFLKLPPQPCAVLLVPQVYGDLGDVSVLVYRMKQNAKVVSCM